ncbi:hypothetical protein V9T40_008809, partial [Parthenolecanium corni]
MAGPIGLKLAPK